VRAPDELLPRNDQFRLRPPISQRGSRRTAEGRAAAFHRQLVFGDLSAEYDNEIRQWLEDLKELDAQDDANKAA